MNGIELLKEVRKQIENPPLSVMMTAYSDVDSAVDAMKAGAKDFISKPFDMEDLIAITKPHFDYVDLLNERDVLKAQLKKKTYLNIVGSSVPIKDVYQLISKVAKTNSTVLITGDTGTGKELVSRAIHAQSDRNQEPFIAINCTTISENILESELFGHEKGAFTDAKNTKKGLFEIADSGTILLDEIGDMPMQLQVKLLRVLQDKRFRRIGGHKDIQVDVRIISATHQNLEQKIADGSFREDLYFRLNVFPIHLPSLKERDDDVVLIAEAIIHELAEDFGREPKKISEEAKQAFLSYDWPGNIRELRNILERIMILEEDKTIKKSSLPHFFNTKSGLNISVETFKKSKEKAVSEFEINYLINLLKQYKGNVTQASEAAQIDRTVFQRYLKKYKIQSSTYKN